jgi:hypothetical protein|tara:strand:+ start:9614 stop:10642 length:1029 start_codon:yes stop_codon:yes gene_type:complete
MAGEVKPATEKQADKAVTEPVTTPETPSGAVPTTPDDTAEFDKSFDTFAGDETPPADPLPEPDSPATGDEPSAKKAEPEGTGPSQATEPTPAVDIWADATPEQKAAFGAAEADAHRYRSDRGRAAADARRIAELESTNRDAAAQKPDAAPADGVLAGVLRSGDWKAVKAELPELAAPLEKVLEGFETENIALKKELATFSVERRNEVSDAQIRIVAAEHSDWESVTDDEAFVQWVGTQPAFIQQMLNRNAEQVVDGLESAHLVSLYKASDGYTPPVPATPSPGSQTNSPATTDKGGEPNKRDRDSQRRLEGNVSVPSKGPGAPSGPPEEFDSAFEHYAAQGT